jgi:acyl-coenzyme A thioesterase PaaI-like protein
LSYVASVFHLPPRESERLICRAQVLRSGRTLVPVEARVYVVRDGQESLCAVALASMAVRQAARMSPVAA